MSGPQCCENPPSLGSSNGSSAGKVEEVAGVKSYVVGSPNSHSAVILISDVFGYEAPKLRKLADKVSAAGFYVVVPDFFHGDPNSPDIAERPLQVWLKDHGPAQSVEEAKLIIEAVKSKGLSKIGAAGFCWGAKVTVDLTKDAHVQAAVLLHPSFINVDDFQDVKVPISVLGAEIDHYSPPQIVKQFEEVLDKRPEVDHFVKIFPGVAHGWSVRYKD